MNLVLTARLEILTYQIPDCFTRAMVNVRGCEIPRKVIQAATIVVSCGLANFAQSSWSTHRRHEFWGMEKELHTKEDNDKFVRSFKDNYLVMCQGRSKWTIFCRKFDDLDNNRSARKHIGRNMYTRHQTRTQCHVPAHANFLAQCSFVCLVISLHMHNTCMWLKSQWSVVFAKFFVLTLRAAWHTVHLL